MASDKGIRAGRAFVELFVDNGKLASGLRKASAKLQAWGATLKGIGTKMLGMGAAVAGPMIAASKHAATAGAELYDMAEKTGVSIEKLSALQYAAEMSGLALEDVAGSFSHLARSLVITGGNAEEVQKKLRLLGLQASDLRGMSPEQLFETIAGKLSEIKDPTMRAAAAMQFFGESGAKMLPLINNWARLNDEANRMGFIKSPEEAKRAKEMANLWTVLGKAIDSISTTIGDALFPVLEPLMQYVLQVLLNVRDWIKENKELVQTVFKVAAAVFGCGAALMGIGVVIGKLGAIFGVLSSVVPMIGTALSALVGVFGFLITPIGALVGAIAVLAGYWLYSSGAMGEASDWLSEVFTGLKDDACKAFAGISDALAAGDFELAARILWTTLRIWWTKGTNWISSIWNDAMGWLTQRFYEAIGGWRIIFEEIGHGLMVAWINIVAGLSSVWYNFVYGIQVAWNWCGKMLTKAWNAIKGVFDKDFDSEAANKAAEDAYQNKVKELQDEKGNKLKAVDDEYNKNMADEKKLNEDNLTKIINDTEAAKSKDQAERDAKEKKNAEDLAALQKERDALVGKAKDERVEHDLKNKRPGDLKDPKDFMKNSDFDVMGLKQSYSTVGSFSGMGAFGLAGGSALDQTAKNTKKTADNTQALIDIMAGSTGLTFA